MAMLSVNGLNQYYGGSHILRDVAFDLPVGVTVLLGRNGVGKTTLLRTLMGLVPPRTGTVTFEGRDLTHARPYERAAAGVGYVPQGREIFPRLTVAENLAMGLATKARGAELPPRIFEMFPVLKQMMRRRGGDLSGGQQQQLAIGRALASDPRFLILDEPAEGIQPNIVKQIGDVILHLNREKGLTVLLVEQKLPFARRVADRFCIMDRGRAMVSGAMEELDQDVVEKYLTV